MTGPEVLDIAQDAVWVTVRIAAPTMVIGLAVGVVVALIQALTQIQEATLAFVPKILAIFVTLVVTLPYMSAELQGFMTRIGERMIGG